MEFWLGVIVAYIAYKIFKWVKNKPNTVGFTQTQTPISKTKTNLAKHGIGKRRTSRKFATVEKPDVELSEESKQILELLENTKTNVFLTGKAGTGKSTLLKYFRATTKKNVTVLAPTGVAAINVHGQTIHSFFGFGIDIAPDRVKKRYGEKAKIYKSLDMLIIDEISMVRADLFECVDKFMRLNGPNKNKSFGGVQILVIGDLYQLPPIVKREEQQFFKETYGGSFFFRTKEYDDAGFVKMELTHVYRQDDESFIEILDAFRTASFNDGHIKRINTRHVTDYKKPEDEFVISIVTKNKIADDINTAELEKLDVEPQTYRGSITGKFKEKDLPTAMEIVVKEGAQVMLLNNDPRGKWINGDIVKVIKTNPTSVRVLFDDGTFDDVGVNKWDAVEFVLDERSGKVMPEIVGSFTQIPIKLAWAITIHKSQGKTFDKAHIDFGTGTFAPGQAYVALSRCRTLEGIVLASPVESHHIFVDEEVKGFMSA